MAREMEDWRRKLAAVNDDPVESPADYPPDVQLPPPARHPGQRERVIRKLRAARAARPKPTVAISYRGGFGYDEGAFTKRDTISATVRSAPAGFRALPREASDDDVAARERAAIAARRRAVGDTQGVEGRMRRQLDDVSGLYIPGGQDIPKHGGDEQVTREAYELAIVRAARSIGMPTLAICGGSRAFARAFGGREALLDLEDERIHNKKGTIEMAHGLELRPHTILGGVSGGTVDAINSTHQKIADLSTVRKLPATGQHELQISARHGTHPEGFETVYGAPMVGVTSHPEAIHGANTKAREAATAQGKAWSDRVFRAFEEEMKTYAGRKRVNEAIRRRPRVD